MPRYDALYETLADRAARQGGIDFEAFVERALSAGMAPDRVQQQLQLDLDNNGPIFGRFMRSLVGAAKSSVMAAERQGAVAGWAAEEAAMRSLLSVEEMLAAEQGDPESLESIEAKTSELAEETWIATMVNTCHLCLPLHGQTRRRIDWLEMGLHPDTIHANEGWTSECQCNLVPASAVSGGRADIAKPLVRTKLKPPEGKKVSKRTQRAVMQRDLEKSQAAVAEAMQSETGRRTLRLLGEARTLGIE